MSNQAIGCTGTPGFANFIRYTANRSTPPYVPPWGQYPSFPPYTTDQRIMQEVQQWYVNEHGQKKQTATEITQKGKENMRHLYHIHIVNPKTGSVEHEAKVVAKDETQAMLKAGIPEQIRENLDEYDVIVSVIGNVRAKKETQKVQVVQE